MLDETSGEKAALAEGIVAVAFAGHLVFATEVESPEIPALHDADGIVIHLGVGPHLLDVVALVELGVELTSEAEALVELLLLHAAEFRILQSTERVVDRERLVFGLEEPSPAVDAAVGTDVDGSRKVRIKPPFELERPGTDSGVADRGALLVAGVHQVIPLIVGTSGRGQRSHDRELVGLGGEARKQRRNLDVVDGGVDRLRLALVLVPRLGVKGIEVRHAPVHVEVDDVLRGTGPLGDA